MRNNHLSGYPVTVQLPVAWGDMDAYQHVNNVMYFKYFETARIAYFEQVAGSGDIGEDGIGPILATTSCQFRAPMTYPDTVTVGARVSIVGEDRFTMEYAVFSQKGQVITARGDGVVVSFNYKTGSKAPLPAAWRARIEAIEGGAVLPEVQGG